jgi:hypothetical protein
MKFAFLSKNESEADILGSEDRGKKFYYEAYPESKDTSRVGRKGNFYVYCGNTAVDLDPLPVSRARLTVVEPAWFE